MKAATKVLPTLSQTELPRPVEPWICWQQVASTIWELETTHPAQLSSWQMVAGKGREYIGTQCFCPLWNQRLIKKIQFPSSSSSMGGKSQVAHPLPSASSSGNLTKVKSAFCRELRRLLAAGQTMPWRLGRQEAHRHRALAPPSTVALALAGLNCYCKSTLTMRIFSIN